MSECDERLAAEIEAAHANGQWGISGQQIETRLTICRECTLFCGDRCGRIGDHPQGTRHFVAGLVARSGPCSKWHQLQIEN